MRVLVALGVTALLWAVVAVANRATHSEIPGLLILLGTALWAAVDSSNLELKKYNGGVDHPILAFLGIAFFWIIFFPTYLVVRSRRINGELQLKRRYREQGQAEADDKPERVGPGPWVRAIVYGVTWLPVFVNALATVPQFEPVFTKLEEKGELPELTGWLMAFSRMDAVGLHLPVLAVVLALAVIDQAAVSLLRQQTRGSLWSWLWVVAAGLAGVVAQIVIVAALLLPVFKMGSMVQ
jgi:hypothetical protein